jgi:drug/metabolite transporter (DMT)-like permease
MSGSVLLLVLLAAFLHAAWNALLRGGRDRFWGMTIMSFTAGIVCCAFVPFLPFPHARAWPFIIGSALVHIIYNLLLVRQYRQGDFGHTYPVARGSSPMLIALGGVLFASEHLSLHVVLGIVLISFGILSLAIGAKAHFDTFLGAFTTGCSIAVYSVIDALGSRVSGHAVAFTAWMVMGYGLPMPLIFLLARNGGDKRLWIADRRELLKAAGGGVTSIIAYGIVVWAMAHSPMGPVSALRETSTLFAVILGCVFLKEKFTFQKAFAAILIVIGNITLHFP